MPPVIAAVAAISLTSVLTSIAVSVVSAVVIGALSQALAGGDQPKAAAGVQSQTTTIKQALVSWKVIYGRARVGGAWVYIHTTGNPVIGQNSALMGAIVLACHECDAIEKIYFGDVEVKLDASGNALGKWRNYVHIWKHLGTPGQAADPQLINWGDGTWTSAHRLAGRCYIAIDLAYNQDLFPSMPMISATIRGKKVVDYRDGGTRWSDNAALCIADYLTEPTYGMAFPAATELDLANFNAEANHCDEIVQTSPIGGGCRLPQDHFVAEKAKTYTYRIGGPRGESGTGTRTLPGAFTIDSDTLGFDTGDRVMLTGNSLPPGVAANTAYYVIRQSDGNDYHSGLAEHPSLAGHSAGDDAGQCPGGHRRLTITGNGSGTVWMLDRFWLLSTDTASLATGDFVQVYQADGNPLPAPLVNGGSYYWIDRGHQQVYYETTTICWPWLGDAGL